MADATTAPAPKPATGIKAIAQGRSDLHRVDPKLIQVREGWNCRDFSDPENMDHVNRLVESIRSEGVKEPLTVEMDGETPFLTNGECRLRAVMTLIESGHEVKTVPVQVERKIGGDADRMVAQITRNAGKPFTALENAELFTRLTDSGLTTRDIADKSGYTIERVRQLLALAKATPATKKAIQSGDVAATTVQRALTKAATPEEAEAAVLAGVKTAKETGKGKAKPRDVAPKPEGGEAVKEKPAKQPTKAEAKAKEKAEAKAAEAKEAKAAAKEAEKTVSSLEKENEKLTAMLTELLGFADEDKGRGPINLICPRGRVKAARKLIGLAEDGSDNEGDDGTSSVL